MDLNEKIIYRVYFYYTGDKHEDFDNPEKAYAFYKKNNCYCIHKYYPESNVFIRWL